MDYGDKLPPSYWYIFTPPRRYIFSPPLTVLTLNMGVLLWLPRLDIFDPHAPFRSPGHQLSANKFRAVVGANGLQFTYSTPNALNTASTGSE